MKPAPTLADALLRMSMGKFHRETDTHGWLTKHISEARRFVLDQSMSAFMADLAWASLLTTKTNAGAHRLMNGMRSLARLPHRLTWIEYDMFAKAERAKSEYGVATPTRPRDLPDRCGWLCMQHPQLETAFYAIECASHSWSDDMGVRINEPTACPIAYQWRSDEGAPPWPMVPPSGIWSSLMATGWSVPAILTGVSNYKTDSLALSYPFHVERAVAENYYKATTYDILREFTSDVRYLWSLLATVNDLPTRTVDVQPSKGFIDRRGRYRRFLEHKVVTLTVPAKAYKRTAMRAIALARRRAHMVRGHWRKDWRHPGERLWIREHERGDASLGHVRHDYVVERGET